MSEEKPQSSSVTDPAAIDKYKVQLSRHDHEWSILISRVQALLTSQSLLATGAALLVTSDESPSYKLAFFSAIGLSLSFFASIAIAINCNVIRKWHRQIRTLIDNTTDKATGLGQLDGYYMPRRQPDGFHTVSVDVMSVGLCLITGVAWIVTFAHDKAPWVWNFLGILAFGWLILVGWIYRAEIR